MLLALIIERETQGPIEIITQWRNGKIISMAGIELIPRKFVPKSKLIRIVTVIRLYEALDVYYNLIKENENSTIIKEVVLAMKTLKTQYRL